MDVVVEYSIMPQEYLVPVWNMSNKVQAETGVIKSFVVGFSGGGSSNFMVALSSAAAMLSENDSMKTALLVTGDATIRATASSTLLTRSPSWGTERVQLSCNAALPRA